MAQLLVSVRSSDEARAALEGGAGLIDIKEPSRGPLGRASSSVWREVLDEVQGRTPVSVALGELREIDEATTVDIPGLAFRKLGLSGAGRDWRERWATLRSRATGTHWVAVVYSDWAECNAPMPSEVIDAALGIEDCRGLLIDTFFKNRMTMIDASWAELIRAIKSSGRLTALAGGLDLPTIQRLAPLEPDYFAVRGAVCDGSREASVQIEKVAALAAALKKG